MELAKQKIWLWRPKTKPISPILEENYLCCFGKCTALQAFRTVNYARLCLFVGLFLILLCRWIYYQVFDIRFDNRRVDLVEAFLNMMTLVSINLFGSVLAVVSIQTLKPLWTQIYMIYANIYFVLGSFWSANVFFWKLGQLNFGTGALLGSNHSSYIDQVFGWDIYRDSNLTTQRAVSCVIAGFLFCYYTWQLMISYSFYHFVRDKQLETEGQTVFAGFDNRSHVNGYRLFSIWCWVPKQRSGFQSPVLRENYRTCCCPVIPVIRVMQCVNLLFLALPIYWTYIDNHFFDVLTRENQYKKIIVFAYMMLVSVLGFLSTFRREPSLVQIYGLLSIINWALVGTAVVGWISWGIIGCFVGIRKPEDLDGANRELRKLIGFELNSRYEILGFLIIPVLMEVIFIWELKIISTYYRFVRDRQLEFEGYRENEDLLTEDENLSVNEVEDQIENDQHPPPSPTVSAT